DRLGRVTFDGSGCTISQAAADITAELAEGSSLAAVQGLAVSEVVNRLGGTARLDCASLGLQTLQRALAGAGETARAHVKPPDRPRLVAPARDSRSVRPVLVD